MFFNVLKSTPVTNYQFKLRKIPDERRSQLLRKFTMLGEV